MPGEPTITRPQDKATTPERTSNPIPDEYLSEPIQWWSIARLIAGLALTAGMLPLGLGYTLAFFALEGRSTPMTYYWLLPATIATVALTWGLGSKASIRPWNRVVGTAVVLVWFIATSVMALYLTSAREGHYAIIALYAASTLWMPWLAWIGYPPIGIFSRLAILTVLAAMILGFHQLVEVPGLAGSSLVYVSWRGANEGPSLAADAKEATVQTIDLTPTPYDFPQFLGPTRDAVTTGVELESDWSKKPPKGIWRQPIGKGWGSFAIVGDVAYTMEQRGPKECAVCYELRTGKVLWLYADEAIFESTFGGDGPRTTPAVADGDVYTVGATGIVNCLSGSSGKLVWSTPILKNAAGNLMHGVCASPLVYGTALFVCPVTTDDESLAALDRATGRILFRAGGGRASYSSPMLATLGGTEQLLCFNAQKVASHDPKSGDVLWTFDWGNDSGVNAGQPVIYRDDCDNVLLSTGYGIGSTLVSVSKNADGRWEATQRWKTIKMRNKFSTCLLIGDMAVGLDDGILAAVDLPTGKQLWKKGRYGHGQILMVGKKLLVLTETGDLLLVEVSKKGAIELGKVEEAIRGKTWNHLAFSPPYLLIRNSDEAACYRLAIEGQEEEGSSAPEAAPPEAPATPATVDVPVKDPLAPPPQEKPAAPKPPEEDPLALPEFDSLLPGEAKEPPRGSNDPLPAPPSFNP